jgi:hypothetical protein
LKKERPKRIVTVPRCDSRVNIEQGMRRPVGACYPGKWNKHQSQY